MTFEILVQRGRGGRTRAGAARPLALVTAVLLTACAVPFVGGGDEKAECDQIAAQAIQTESVEEARNLAARATECYARLAR